MSALAIQNAYLLWLAMLFAHNNVYWRKCAMERVLNGYSNETIQTICLAPAN